MAPERRGAIVVICTIAAVLLLGLGAIGGSLLTGHRESRFGPIGRDRGHARFLPGGNPGQFAPFPHRTLNPALPTPSPSATR